ncbi:MAG: DUF3343 domain-containing protein [Clostridia bacterium]|nr:DUF3343 domain-containing protein [Clostridia bacterium]
MLKQAEKRLVITFHTTAGAMAMEKLCKKNAIPGRLVPVPRELTSDCGIAWSMAPADRAHLEPLLTGDSDISGVYELML